MTNNALEINKTITLIRNIDIKHQHGGSSRINPKIWPLQNLKL